MTRSERLAPASCRATLRPVRAADATAMQAFVTGLGAGDRRLRFHGAVNACAPGLLRHLTEVDGVRHVAFVACAEGEGEADEGVRIVGEARYVVTGAAGASAELAIAVADDHRGRGIADELLRALLGAAVEAGIGRLHGDVLAGNVRMAAFMRRHGFEIDPFADAEPGLARWQRGLSGHNGRKATRPSLAVFGAWLGRVAAHHLVV